MKAIEITFMITEKNNKQKKINDIIEYKENEKPEKTVKKHMNLVKKYYKTDKIRLNKVINIENITFEIIEW